jgi:hypothetical protein
MTCEQPANFSKVRSGGVRAGFGLGQRIIMIFSGFNDIDMYPVSICVHEYTSTSMCIVPCSLYR